MHDLVIQGGTVVDGTGADPVTADVAIDGDTITEVGRIEERGRRVIDADGMIVTPGFVDIHTHLDAQFGWEPVGTSSCWHGVTSAVLGNCGVTFAPCRPEDRQELAELMEAVEDIPADAILGGLPWSWETYGEYLAWLDATPTGLNVGGLVGHCAVRLYAMGERALDEGPAGPEDLAGMAALVDEAMAGGALGFSTSRTFLHRVPDGRPVPGTYAAAEELFAFADVLGRHGRGVFEAAARLGEQDGAELENTRAEMAMLGEISRRSGRPVTFGLAQSNRRPDLYAQVVKWARDENEQGGLIRPQTTARGIGVLFGLSCGRTPFDGGAEWKSLRGLSPASRLAAVRDPERHRRLVEEAPTALDLRHLYLLTGPDARYDCRPEDSLVAEAERRGVTPAEAFLQLNDESDGAVLFSMPFLNESLDAVQELLDDPNVSMGLADAGAHVGQIMDTSQPTFFLTYWIRDQGRWSLPEGIRRMTSDTAGLFGLSDRGVLRAGAKADVNVIDLDGLRLPPPVYVHDYPNDAGRFIQKARGYAATLVNGEVMMEDGEHTGALPGRLLRPGA